MLTDRLKEWLSSLEGEASWGGLVKAGPADDAEMKSPGRMIHLVRR